MSQKPITGAGQVEFDASSATKTAGLIVGARYAATVGDEASNFNSQKVTPNLSDGADTPRLTPLATPGESDADANPLEFTTYGHFEFVATRPLIAFVPDGEITALLIDLVMIESPPNAQIL